MLKMTRFIKHNQTSPPQGFTMLEVLMGILMTTAFVAATLQLLLINAMFKVKAEREAQALFWIQDDKEMIRARAATIPETSSACGSTTNPYSAILWKNLTGQTSLVGGNSTLILKHGPVTTGTKEIINKQYELKRTYTITKAKPNTLKIEFSVVDPSTQQTLAGGGTIKATTIESVDEVIPDRVYQCP